ncbi:dgo [Drosophila busckii]|uniref:Dgo n=1 Tax=Drosophila busckii TaxID=30019 RepID=A0A0M4EEY7_DROBS|nr:dgo [Drosophila busckii]
MQYGPFSMRNIKQEALPNAISGSESLSWTALHEAVAAGDDQRVEILISRKADRLAKDSNQGNTPLHEAASRGYSRCVKLMCTAPSAKTQHKDKSKIKARASNTIEALHNSTLSISNNEGLAALHLAAQNGHNQSSRELLLAGADPDVQNYGDTALHTACRYGHAGVTRILLSGLCDPNKTNLNGDTALHITCAMGRRKLTRILLESNARLNLRNAQGDTPLNIAIRKNYREIIEILNTPKRIRNRTEITSKHGKQEPSDKEKKNDIRKDTADKPINWSPYGCHYFPDPRSFPSPKLETLPKEPLKQGEQYFLDLAGNIHKGPVSLGNTCYCGPFFRHIESKLNLNRKSLKKYVHKTKERLGHKVQALAIKTNDQIEQLTRSMIEDRIRCESRRYYLNEYLCRGGALRSTLDNQIKNPRIEQTLSRCRSLDLIDCNLDSGTMPTSRSVDILEKDNQFDIADIKKPHIHFIDSGDEIGSRNISTSNSDCSVGMPVPLLDNCVHSLSQLAAVASQGELRQSKLEELKIDFLKVSERLGNLLDKTTLIMKKDNEQERRHPSNFILPTNISINSPTGHFNLLEARDCADALKYDYYKNTRRRYPYSSKTSQPSQYLKSSEFDIVSGHSEKYKNCIGERGDITLKTVIKALRKDASFTDISKDDSSLNENAGMICGDKLLYKDQSSKDFPPTFCRETVGSSSQQLRVSCPKNLSNILKRQPLCLEESFTENPRLLVPSPMAADIPESNNELQIRTQGSQNTLSKVEIRNSEIKSLKHSKSRQVLDLVVQGESEVDSNYQNLRKVCRNGIADPVQIEPNYSYFHAFELGKVPKDAYFHELPTRSQNVQKTSVIYPSDVQNICVPRGYSYDVKDEDIALHTPSTLHQQKNIIIPTSKAAINRATNFRLAHTSNFYGSVASKSTQELASRHRTAHDVLSDEIDADEMAAVGIYNNVSSLV